MPIIDGCKHDEQSLFVSIGLAVRGGINVPVPGWPVTPENYETDIAAVLGASPARVAAIVAQYPLAAYASAPVAFSTLVADANFACPGLQLDRWTSARMPTFVYEFNDDNAPQRFVPPGIVPQGGGRTGPSCSTTSTSPTRRCRARSTPTSSSSPPPCARHRRASPPTGTRE